MGRFAFSSLVHFCKASVSERSSLEFLLNSVKIWSRVTSVGSIIWVESNGKVTVVKVWKITRTYFSPTSKGKHMPVVVPRVGVQKMPHGVV